MHTRRHVLFIFRSARASRLRQYEQGDSPSDMLYGFCDLDKTKYVTELREGGGQQRSLIRLLTFPIEYMISRTVKIGFALYIALEQVQALRQADVIISTNDSCGLPIAWLKRLKIVKTPLIYFCQGLSDRMVALSDRPLWYRIFFPFYRSLLQTCEQIVVLGEGAQKHLIEVFDLVPEKVQFIPFGVDVNFWHPRAADHQGDFMLSVGTDAARDYDTLLHAVTQNPPPSQPRLQIVTKQSLPQARGLHHVEVGTDYTDTQLRDLNQQAMFVIIPLRDVTQPSGQSATLQAMACGKAVILSAIRGLWEAEQLRHMENCYLVKPGSVTELQQAIAFMSSHPAEAARIGQNGRRLVETRYSSQHFARTLEQCIESVAK